jgi:hypothetical protein
VPIAEDDVARALRSAAVAAVDTTGVVERVAAKRARRRTTRALGMSVVAVVLAFVVVGSVVLVSRDHDARITTPAATAQGVVPIVLSPDQGYLRGPLTMSDDLVSVAAYEPDGAGGYEFPGSRVVRFDPGTLQVRDRVDLKAEIVSVADGADGVRWAITRNRDPDGPEGPVPAGHFLKRIDADGTVHSFDLPAGTDAVCCVKVLEDRAVVPTSRDVLVFDLQGRPTSTAGLFPSDGRLMVVDGMAVEQTHRAGNRTWYTGVRGGLPAVVLQERGRIVDTITLPGADEGSFVWVDDDNVLATSGGRLLRIAVDRD